MKRALMMGLAMATLAIGLACEPSNACDEYVNYLCDCDAEIDCDQLAAEFEDADQSRQDSCQAEMSCLRSNDGGEACSNYDPEAETCI